MDKNKKESILNILEICLISVIAVLLFVSVIFTAIKFETVYTYYSSGWHSTTRYLNMFYYETALSVLVAVFSGITLLVTPLVLIFRKKKFFKFIYLFFLFASSGVILADGICNTDYFSNNEPVALIVFGGLALIIAIAYFVLFIIKPKCLGLNSSEETKKKELIAEEKHETKNDLILKVDKEEPSLCPQCGKTRQPGDRFCSSCGYKFSEEVAVIKEKSNLPWLTKIAQIFFYIGFGLTCATVIGLCWALPMLYIYKRDRDTVGKHSIAFKVCTIIFISQVAGILMLIDYEH